LYDHITLLIGASSSSPAPLQNVPLSGDPFAAVAVGGQAAVSAIKPRLKAGGPAAASTPKHTPSTAPSPADSSQASLSAEVARTTPAVTSDSQPTPSSASSGAPSSSLSQSKKPASPTSSPAALPSASDASTHKACTKEPSPAVVDALAPVVVMPAPASSQVDACSAASGFSSRFMRNAAIGIVLAAAIYFVSKRRRH
jgi:hypothetical protein